MKTDVIRNPLTLIAIFAGISEVAMATVLPSLPLENQKIFMWFVMAYPLLLVCGFFYVLIWKREALYAPSDFKDDATWLRVLQNNQRKILDKYPLEPAIAAPSETDAGSDQREDQILLEQNSFYNFLKSLHLTPDTIKQMMAGVNNADDLSTLAFKLTSNNGISEKIKKVFNDFPGSKDDFEKLKLKITEADK